MSGASTATGAASVVREGEALVFRGALDRAAAPALWKQAQPLLAGSRRFALGAADAIDSAGLALLAELAELAGRVPGIVVEGDPPGLSELRAAYRLGPDLGFGSGS